MHGHDIFSKVQCPIPIFVKYLICISAIVICLSTAMKNIGFERNVPRSLKSLPWKYISKSIGEDFAWHFPIRTKQRNGMIDLLVSSLFPLTKVPKILHAYPVVRLRPCCRWHVECRRFALMLTLKEEEGRKQFVFRYWSNRILDALLSSWQFFLLLLFVPVWFVRLLLLRACPPAIRRLSSLSIDLWRLSWLVADASVARKS